MESSYQIVALPPALFAVLGYRYLLVEAIELTGSSILCGSTVPPPYALAGEAVKVSREHFAVLEQLFAEACRASRGPEYHDARHAGGRARDAARGIKTYGNSFGTLSRNRRSL